MKRSEDNCKDAIQKEEQNQYKVKALEAFM